MAQKERPDEDPSLEMPSLGSLFKRGRKKSAPEPRADEPSAEDFERLVKGAAAKVEEAKVEETKVEEPKAEEVEEPEIVPDTQDTAVIDLPEHDLIAEAEEADLADIEEDEPVEAAAPPEAAPATVAEAATLERRRTAVDVKDEPEDEPDDAGDDDTAKPARRTSDFALPALPAAIAAAVTGAIVGLLAVGLTYGGLEGCEAVKGTSACGGPGIPILGLIMVALVIVGSVLLGAWKVTDSTSTSFLAVGLLAVIALLFLINVIFSPAMIIVIPLVSVATYSLSQWVTAHFIEED